MEVVVEFFEKEHFTTDDAIAAVNELLNKYESIIGRILKIKQDMPEEDVGFRRRSQKTELLEELQAILLDLGEKISEVEQKLIDSEAVDFTKKDNPRLNQVILDLLVQAIERCHQVYANQSKSFAVLLQDLERLLVQCQRKADLSESEDSSEATMQQGKRQQSVTEPGEMLVYVRVFHRRMPTLLEPKESLSWLKGVLDSVQTAEKHGLAVYEKEDEVKHSLKNDCYAYATLKITSQQNITDQRPPKIDTASGVRLLTIGPVGFQNLLKLTYAGRDYVIKDGVVLRPQA